MKILILCTGNSCRSQMAEAILSSFDADLIVCSAGTNPSDKVHPYAIEVIKDLGLDISASKTQNVDVFLKQEFDYVITVCGDAKENCPVFTGKVKNRIHIGFDDPADAKGSKEEILAVFKRVRNEILVGFYAFYNNNIR